MTIKPADLQKAVEEMLTEYAEQVEEATGKAVENTATQTVREIKKYPAGFKDKSYSRGWTKQVTKHRLYSEATIYNKTEGHLTHLLEFGHAKQNGGRTRAYPHIEPVNNMVPEMFEKNITEAINNI